MIQFHAPLVVLPHQTRRSALRLLQPDDEFCLRELMGRLEAGQSTMWRHVATPKETGLANDHRDAECVRYCLHPRLDAPSERIVFAILGEGEASDADRVTVLESRSAA